MQIRVGTSGWSYKEWKGPFYPATIAANEMLRFYAERFSAVEVDNTFYRLPKREVLAAWAAEVPERFVFALKVSRRITHIARLKDAADPLDYLLRTAATLGPRLGPFLVQLPPNLKKDVPRLRDFLALLAPPARAAFEFRHRSWFDDEVYAALRERNAAWCVADTGGEDDPPFVSTADWGYFRLRRAAYDEADLRSWAERIRAQAWEEAFAFFKHEEAGTGPRLAAQFLRIWGEV